MMFWAGLLLGLAIGFGAGAWAVFAGKNEIVRRAMVKEAQAQAVIDQRQSGGTQQLYPENVSMSHSPGSCAQFLCNFGTGEIRGLNGWEGGNGAEDEVSGV